MALLSLQTPRAPRMLLSASGVQLPSREASGWTQDLGANRQPVLPVGAVYVGHSNVPVFGRQSFILQTVTRTRAKIALVGPMKLDEELFYREEADCNDVCRYHVELNEATQKFLKRFRTRISSTTYHVDGDYALLHVKPAIFPTISVRLDRLNPS
jgi:hypothetical protein